MKNVHYLTMACAEIIEAINDSRYRSAIHTIELLDFVPTNDEVESILRHVKTCLSHQNVAGVSAEKQKQYVEAARTATANLQQIVSEYSAVTSKLDGVLISIQAVTY